MIEYRPVRIDSQGRSYSARYSVEAGHLCVDSAYGSRRCAVVKDPAKVKAQAEMLLRQIVEER